MKFENLSKEHQEFLMHCLFDLSTSKSPSRHKIDLSLIDVASKLLRIVMES